MNLWNTTKKIIGMTLVGTFLYASNALAADKHGAITTPDNKKVVGGISTPDKNKKLKATGYVEGHSETSTGNVGYPDGSKNSLEGNGSIYGAGFGINKGNLGLIVYCEGKNGELTMSNGTGDFAKIKNTGYGIGAGVNLGKENLNGTVDFGYQSSEKEFDYTDAIDLELSEKITNFMFGASLKSPNILTYDGEGDNELNLGLEAGIVGKSGNVKQTGGEENIDGKNSGMWGYAGLTGNWKAIVDGNFGLYVDHRSETADLESEDKVSGTSLVPMVQVDITDNFYAGAEAMFNIVDNGLSEEGYSAFAGIQHKGWNGEVVYGSNKLEQTTDFATGNIDNDYIGLRVGLNMPKNMIRTKCPFLLKSKRHK